MSVKTALLLFYKDSENESKKGIAKTQNLFKALNNHLIDKLSKKNIDLILFNESFQRGNDFGTRYYNALNDTFNSGYKKVISIGNDTPQLSWQQIKYAQTQTAKGKMCIGPSHDGGFYLWALHRDDLQHVDFKKINWQTRHVFDQLKDQLQMKGVAFDQLKRLTDIDDQLTLLKVYHRLSHQHPLKDILRTGLSRSSKLSFFENTDHPKDHYSSYFFNKGPPGPFLASR
ncbi:MAG: DUF2064 domain-containing protein [Psychroflexus sp.]|jgi:hypothetical protein|nr:DUF2064 domain-containing protein [Psychroflexus sp.]MDR9448986.1 DUF2064 domain-containing protein [Psychroflexus sp.]